MAIVTKYIWENKEKYMNLSKPFIMNIEILQLDFNEPMEMNSRQYEEYRVTMDKNYKKAVDESIKFVIPKLNAFKRNNYPQCCLSNPNFVMRHPHYFYKLLIELESMKDQLNRIIKSPIGVMEIKITI